MQKMSDPAPTACPECKSGPMNKLMSKTAFVLKGGGWYVTDFKNGSHKRPATSDAAYKADVATGDAKVATEAADKAAKKAEPTTAPPSSTATASKP